MEFAAIQTKPTSVGFKFFESAYVDYSAGSPTGYVCVAAISNRLVYLLSCSYLLIKLVKITVLAILGV